MPIELSHYCSPGSLRSESVMEIVVDPSEQADPVTGRIDGSGVLLGLFDGSSNWFGCERSLRISRDHLNRLREVLDDAENPHRLLTQSLQSVGRLVFKLRKDRSLDPETSGVHPLCATTAWITWNNAWISHVGTSLMLRARGNLIVCLTKPHTLAQKWRDTGEMSEKEIAEAPIGKVITRGVGSLEETEVDETWSELTENDLFVLVSDSYPREVLEERVIPSLEYSEKTAAEVCNFMVEELGETPPRLPTGLVVVRVTGPGRH